MAEEEATNKNATIIDVARKCGVSVATVSRVVNKSYPVSEKTRERVQAAIDELHYVPNVQARELNLRQSTTIGVVVPGLYNMFFAKIIDGIEATASNGRYSLLLSCARKGPAQEQAAAKELIARNVAGIIIISSDTESQEEAFYKRLAARTPLVFINGYREIEGVSYAMAAEGADTCIANLVPPKQAVFDQQIFQLGCAAADLVIRNIRLSQTLPAFLSPNITQLLIKTTA